jgi:hypothetical protein
MMKNVMMFLAAALVAASACQKVEPLTKDSQQIVYATAEAGVHSFGITAEGNWSVTMDEASKQWCEFVGPDYGSGMGAFSVKYDANLADGVRRGLRRQATFTVITDDKFTSVTILFRQGGLTPHVEFKEETYTLDGNSVENSLAINSNLSVHEAPLIKYAVNGSWVNDYRLSHNGAELIISHTANSGTAAREAVAEISFTDCWGETFTDKARIVQSVKQTSPEVSE